MSEADVRVVVDGMVAAWKARDLDGFLSHLAEGVVWEDPAMLDGPAVGHASVRAFSERLLQAFPDFEYRVREPICVAQCGSRCVVPWEIRATHTGVFEPFGLAPTGQVIVMEGVDVLELDGGKVTRIETLFNVLPAVEQAMGLKILSKGSSMRRVAVWLQRWRAHWLRRRIKVNR